MKLFIYCAGGFGREVFDTAKRINDSKKRWEEIGFIDDVRKENEYYGARRVSFERFLERGDFTDVEVSIANGEPFNRKVLYDKLKTCHINLATIIDNSSIISDTARIGEGVIVAPHCLVSSSTAVGDNVVINTKAVVGHDVRLGNHAVISSLVNLGGFCSVGEGSYIGSGTHIKEGGVVIGREAIVGMGSMVYNDIPDEVIALGNPARPMRKNIDKMVFK